MSDEIPIIAGPEQHAIATTTDTGVVPRKGAPGEPALEAQAWWRPFNKKPIKELTDQIAGLHHQIGKIVQSFASAQFMGGAKLREVTVGLAVSIEGTIGIASAGAEASIELAFELPK